MPVNPRTPTDAEKEAITAAAASGKVVLNEKEYRIDYGVATESRVTQENSYKKRTEKLTVSNAEGDVIYFDVVSEAKGQGDEKAALPEPLVENPPSRKPCTFFNKGTCKNGPECQFSHCFIAPRRR